MLRTGIINPHLLELLARVRHTNTVVIADRGFPSWPSVATIDLSLVDDTPTVQEVLRAVLAHWQCGRIWMAEEFALLNPASKLETLSAITGSISIMYESHLHLKTRVPDAIGLIRTGDTTQYANMILESA